MPVIQRDDGTPANLREVDRHFTDEHKKLVFLKGDLSVLDLAHFLQLSRSTGLHEKPQRQFLSETGKETGVAYFEWSDEYSVSVNEIDLQHRKLVEMVNSLNEAMLARKGREAQKAAIDAMVDYSVSHFSVEENYMRRFGFEGLPAHKAEHEKFTIKALELKDRVNRAGFVLTLEIVDFLKQWLTGHIKGTDKQYKECFQAHGLR